MEVNKNMEEPIPMSGEDDQPLPRSVSRMIAEDFSQLLELNLRNAWLRNHSAGLVELWNSCADKSERKLIVDLIDQFCVVDSVKLDVCGKEVAAKILTDWKCMSATTFIVAVGDDEQADGSQAFLQSIKNKFPSELGWKSRNFLNRLSDGVKAAKNGSTIVLLDDFIGTGNTIVRKINWVKMKLAEAKLQDVQIYAIALAGMRFSQNVIAETGVDIFCSLWLKKGITENDSYSDQGKADAIKSMLRLEADLSRKYKSWKLKKFSLGYLQSEALFLMQAYNVPNNVYPIFWWPKSRDGGLRVTLLQRIG